MPQQFINALFFPGKSEKLDLICYFYLDSNDNVLQLVFVLYFFVSLKWQNNQIEKNSKNWQEGNLC